MKAAIVMKKSCWGLLLVMTILMSVCGSASAAQAGKDWYVALRLGYQPYTVEASGKVVNRDFDVKADLSDIMDNTDTTILGGEVEFGMGKWFTVLSSFYQKSELERGTTTLGTRTTFEELGINPMVGYRVYGQSMGGEQALSVDVMAGVFYVKVSTDIDIYDPLGNVVSRGNDIDFLDPMVGVRAYSAFTKKFGVGVSGQIGGFGIGSELQYVAAANLKYSFTDWFSLFGGYKYWYFKYEDDSKPLSRLEQKLYGPIAGVEFRF